MEGPGNESISPSGTGHGGLQVEETHLIVLSMNYNYLFCLDRLIEILLRFVLSIGHLVQGNLQCASACISFRICHLLFPNLGSTKTFGQKMRGIGTGIVAGLGEGPHSTLCTLLERRLEKLKHNNRLNMFRGI